MPGFHRIILPFALSLVAGTCHAQGVITYHIDPRPADKTYHVHMDIPHVHELTVRLQMPVWMPGAYFVGNFATTVADVHAVTAGAADKALRVFHPDANTWEVAANGATAIKVDYTVKNADIELEGGVARRAHISGPRTYMYVVGRKVEPAELSITAPAGIKDWHTITSLDPVGSKPNEYHAPTYDVLADAPVEMGDFLDETFEAGGKPHHVVVYGDYKTTDRVKLADFCKRIATTEIAFFGEAPFARYIFQFRTTSAGPGGAGGLEHLGSTEIGTVGNVDDRVRSVIAHEYFHLWNVKRIRPFVLGPFNYVDPPHTANLWWSEGVTSYYGDLLSLRGGLIEREAYLKHVSDTIAQEQNNGARLKVSADEASLRVWEANNSVGYGGMSYYTKGELIGLCLDLKIRNVTAGRASLDDVMRALWAQVNHGNGPGFGEDDIMKTVNRITGKNLSDFYDSLARSTDELPFEECLGYAGLTLKRVEPARQVGESGLRTQFERSSGQITVTEVTTGGAAESAGIAVGDHITAVNGVSEGRRFVGALMTAKPGEKVNVTLQRAGAHVDAVLTMGSRSVYSYSITPSESATASQSALRDHWLTGH